MEKKEIIEALKSIFDECLKGRTKAGIIEQTNLTLFFNRFSDSYISIFPEKGDSSFIQ